MIELNVSAPIAASTSALQGIRQIVTPMEYGAIADDGLHPLSTRYGSLAAAQADYPFATSLAQQIDYCACKAASNAAFGADGSEHGDANGHLNKRLFIPNGKYQFGDDTWLIRDLSGGVIQGAGKRATILKSNATVLAFDGLWFSQLSDFAVQAQTSTATVALDVDGNVPGHSYATRGVQGNILQNLLIDGGGGTYAMAFLRQGGSGGQGDVDQYINLHFSNADTLYYQNGYNALNNQFIGGNFQNYYTGVLVEGGSVAFYGTCFQSTRGYDQILNSGWDIIVGAAGVFDTIPVYGSRTESLRFLKNFGAVAVDIRGISQGIALPLWAANSVRALNYAIHANNRMFVVTTAGTTGGTIPDFDSVTTTVSDGSVVWTLTAFDFIDSSGALPGSVDKNTIRAFGRLNCRFTDDRVNETDTDNYIMTTEDTLVVHSSGAAKSIYLPVTTLSYANHGRRVTVKRGDSSANDVTINTSDIPLEGGPIVLAGGTLDYVNLQSVCGGLAAARWGRV